jgi:hypothetical protein
VGPSVGWENGPGPTSIDSSTPARELVGAPPRTFFGAPAQPDLDALDAQVAFLGVPYDAGTPQPGNRTGQAAGPAAARLASWEQFDYGSPEEASEAEQCAREDSNLHDLAITSPSSWRVYQFRHRRANGRRS